jgi:hypothetical protein
MADVFISKDSHKRIQISLQTCFLHTASGTVGSESEEEKEKL